MILYSSLSSLISIIALGSFSCARNLRLASTVSALALAGLAIAPASAGAIETPSEELTFSTLLITTQASIPLSRYILPVSFWNFTNPLIPPIFGTVSDRSATTESHGEQPPTPDFGATGPPSPSAKKDTSLQSIPIFLQDCGPHYGTGSQIVAGKEIGKDWEIT